ncbi:phage holin [Martelella alba]|uniref:Lysis protein n=1 Tax=Martelella alba TaxID=2590451 RepID=A0ABY2SVX0_9HYPH|nr:phage holin [Martelella alba]TKI08692.1 lysis protein [Martelella alba]
MKMPEKISTAGAYSSSGLLIALGKIMDWFNYIDWSQAAVIIEIVVVTATSITNVYFQRRQTRAIAAAARDVKTIIPRSE